MFHQAWAKSLLPMQGARVYIAPLFWHVVQGGWRLSRRLRNALQWWLSYLRAVPTRVVRLEKRLTPRSIIYSDATGKGALAFVAQTPWRRLYASTGVTPQLASWVIRRKTQAPVLPIALRTRGEISFDVVFR